METDNEKNSASGNKQSAFAGTNPNRYTQPRSADEQDNPVDAGEAQNVVDGDERISGKEAEAARRKATEGARQGRDD